MKNLRMSGLLVLLMLPALAFSESGEGSSNISLGIDLGGQLPVGNFYDHAGMGFGGGLRYEYSFVPEFACGIRVGYLTHWEKNNVTFSQAPVLAGVKYVLPPDMPLFFTGEAGYFWVNSEASRNSSSKNKIGYVVGAGYPIGLLEVRANLSVWDARHSKDAMGLGLTLGYKFLMM